MSPGEIIIAECYGSQFEVTVTKADEYYIDGTIPWNEQEQARYFALMRANSDHQDEWYLDDNGNRWEGEELFTRSPWTLIDKGKRIKAVKRMLLDGRIKFSIQPWILLADFYHKKK